MAGEVTVIRVIEPAGTAHRQVLERNLESLRSLGFDVRCTFCEPDPDWEYASAAPEVRAGALMQALTDSESRYVLAARGGYGASDLPPLLDWERLESSPPKCLIGLSDVTALHWALYARLGWKGLHAVMPGGKLWQPGTDYTDALLDLLRAGPPWRGTLSMRPVRPGRAGGPIEGPLLGGCLSVLTNLIGTRWFPQSLSGCILYFEDINENPGRVMRFWNQWRQSGALDGVAAVAIGQLAGGHPGNRRQVITELARRTTVPLFECAEFGHEAPSFPVGNGSSGRIDDQGMSWVIEEL